MDPAQGARGAFAQQARCLFQRRRDAGQAGFQRARGNRQEADHVGDDQRAHGAHQEQARAAEYRGDRMVDPDERRQQADGQHRARHRVAQAGDARAGAARIEIGAFAHGAAGPGHDQSAQQGHNGGAERDDQRVAQAVDQLVRYATHQMQALVGFINQIGGRRNEPHHDGDPAQQGGDGGGQTAQAARLHRAHTLRIGVALALAAVALQHDQPDHDGQHRQRDLRSAGQVRPRYPGRIDRHRQRLHAQELGGADIVQRFQQCQADAHDDGRPRQGQGDAKEHCNASGAQCARGFQQAGRLRHEHHAGAQIDIWV
ncbi:hypothetical protein G6F65_016414 [Rhizopus arrhizus]|nr:hypothetical protein G6F65_016414 [Rhizopus arrhizus]